MSQAAPLWHLLQVSDVLDTELASALVETVPVLAWEPLRSLFPFRVLAGSERERLFYNTSPGQAEPPLRIRQLPLLRGFARPPLSFLARTGPSVVARLLKQTPDPERSPLICTTPFFASVAELWPGPVVYWLTDLIAEYTSQDRETVLALDRRICRAATLVCPNSVRLEQYLVDHADCDSEKIHVLPNATRAANLLPTVPRKPATLPVSLKRPIAGVIGNLAGNMDWVLIEQLIDLTPWLSWLFVGPVTMEIPDRLQARARAAVMAHPRAHFAGRQPYGALAAYAQSFDVAVLPYRKCEPTYSGSSTRFYEHLAACRPMIATQGLEELTRKIPLLTLVNTADEAAGALRAWRARDFEDGLGSLRWAASRKATWQVGAACMQQALRARLGHPSGVLSTELQRSALAS